MAPPTAAGVNASYPSELPTAANHGKRTVMTGAERAHTEPEEGFTPPSESGWLGPPADAEAEAAEPLPEPARTRRPARAGLLGTLLILVALGWVGAVGTWLWQT